MSKRMVRAVSPNSVYIEGLTFSLEHFDRSPVSLGLSQSHAGKVGG